MIVSPVIVIGAPRSGTTILHHCLALHSDLWSLPGESHAILEGPFHPAASGYASNRVLAEDVEPALRDGLRRAFFGASINLNRVLPKPHALLSADGLLERALKRTAVRTLGAVSGWRRPKEIRLLEKTPKNTLRVPMLDALFPDARFVWLRRAAEPNVLSIARGWRADDRIGPFRRARFATYPVAGELALRDYASRWWRFVLVPGWRALAGRTIADVAAWQYAQCDRYACSDLARVSPRRVFSVDYDAFIREPTDTVRAVLAWADLTPSDAVDEFTTALPRVNRVRASTAPGGDARLRAAVEEAVYRLQNDPIQLSEATFSHRPRGASEQRAAAGRDV